MPQVAQSIEHWPPSRLTPNPRNSRTHSPTQITQIANSIQRFGFTNPILTTPDGNIIAGHARLAGALQLNMPTVPVIVASGWSPEEIRAYIIADNQLALAAGWDLELLAEELTALHDLDFPLDLLGFNNAELAKLLEPQQGYTDPDDAPEPAANPITQLGDLWLLGQHRLLCGDATNANDVAHLLAGATPHLMVTDPPYGVNYDPDWRNRADRANGLPSCERAIRQPVGDNQSNWSPAWTLFPGDVAYAWHPPGAKQVEHFNALLAAGFEIRMQIIWAKQQFPIGRGNYHVMHEPCWYAVRKGKTAHWQGDRTQTTLWQINKPIKSETGHSTQKPVECMLRPINNNSAHGQALYDPFVGSGTTIIAAEMSQRICYASEINPQFVDLAITRWQNFTHREATLEATSQIFAHVKSRRSQNQQWEEMWRKPLRKTNPQFKE